MENLPKPLSTEELLKIIRDFMKVHPKHMKYNAAKLLITDIAKWGCISVPEIIGLLEIVKRYFLDCEADGEFTMKEPEKEKRRVRQIF
jgi:hypothetical protein